MASSAVYRYFPSRDDLLTALIVEAYDALGAATEEAEAGVPRADLRSRLHAACAAVRAWALAHPHEYALLYGSPVPGYRAPQDTVRAASRVGVVLGRILGEAAQAGLLPEASGEPETGLVSAEAAAVLGGDHPAIDEPVRVRALLAWSALFGTISFELFGHFAGAVEDAGRFFDLAMTELAALVGLGAADGSRAVHR
jgi:AcrR family transcriptional regulator